MALTWKKKYKTGINNNNCSGYTDKHIQNPLSQRTAGMRIELAKKYPNVEKRKEAKFTASIA